MKDVYLKFNELANYRGKDGLINVNCFLGNVSTEREVRGNINRDKIWFTINDGRAMFKANEEDHKMSHYSELICCELAKQAGLETAEYDFAMFNDKEGILTKDMCKESEELLSIRDLIGDNPNDNDEYLDSIDIYWVFDELQNKLEKDGYSNETIDKCMLDLRKQLLFDIFVMEEDRHTENISYIFGKDGKNTQDIRMSPIYDTEDALALSSNNKDMKKIYNDIFKVSNLVSMLEPKMCVLPEPDLKIEEPSNDALSFLKKLQESVKESNIYNTKSEEIWKSTLEFLCEDRRAYEFVEDKLDKMDIKKAIEAVEKKTNSILPEDVKKMATACFNERKHAIEYELGLDLIDITETKKEKNDTMELT